LPASTSDDVGKPAGTGKTRYVLQAHVRLGGQHDAGRAGQAGQRLRRLGQHVLDRLARADAGDLRLDVAAVLLRHVADLHQRIDEEPQAELGRQAAGGGMRREDEAEMLEIRHHVAHRGRRKGHRQDARQVARADRLARREVALHDRAEYLA
jgi:hypothetical protein